LKVEIKNKHLIELYEKGRSRKYRLSEEVIKKFFMRVQQLEASYTIHDLWKTPALNIEKLEGYKNRYSIRITKTWRLEFEIIWENEEKTFGKITVLELSKHYGD